MWSTVEKAPVKSLQRARLKAVVWPLCLHLDHTRPRPRGPVNI